MPASNVISSPLLSHALILIPSQFMCFVVVFVNNPATPGYPPFDPMPGSEFVCLLKLLLLTNNIFNLSGLRWKRKFLICSALHSHRWWTSFTKVLPQLALPIRVNQNGMLRPYIDTAITNTCMYMTRTSGQVNINVTCVTFTLHEILRRDGEPFLCYTYQNGQGPFLYI